MVNTQFKMQRSIRYTLLLVILFTAFAHSLSSQSFVQLSGTVLDDKTREALPYATVRLKEVPEGTITNLKGKFSFWLSSKYAKGTLQVSSVGYYSFEMPVSEFLAMEDKAILLSEDVRKLPGVTVVSDKLLTGKEVLKRAVKRIPENYINQQHAFKAYYRETVTENGAVIKFADAAVTFDQTGYDGENYDRENFGGRTLERVGSWLGGYKGIYRIGDRLHDHFGHRTQKNDRVLVHEARASLNHSRENFRPNIEAGPLATLSKDLVKYLRHFIYKRAYDDYFYELAEIDLGNGDWDYLLRFRPKKEATKLEGERNITGGKIRKHIFIGSMQIDPETYVIKNLHYEVGPKYRPHICSLGMDDIIHYGYSVDVDYAEQEWGWQVERIQRIDRFLLPKSDTEKITPYAARTELVVTDPKVTVELAKNKEFENRNQLFLQEYHTPYNASFWKKYESTTPESQISDSIRRHMEDEMNLEAQFALQGTRQLQFQPPVARRETTGSDGYKWIHQQEFASELVQYQKQELAYTHDYFKPFGKVIRDMQLDFKVAKNRFLKADTVEDREYKNWAEFTDRKGFRKLLKNRKQYNVQTISVNEGLIPDRITLIFLGETKSKSLKKRPIILTIDDGEKMGLQRPFDASIIPMMERGFVFAFINLKEASEPDPAWLLKGSAQQKLKTVDKLVQMVKAVKSSGFGDASKLFIRAQGSGAALVTEAMQSNNQLCLGALLSSPLLFTEGFLLSDYPASAELTKGWGSQRIERKNQNLSQLASYQQKGAQSSVNVAFFTQSEEADNWPVLKTLAKLRAAQLEQQALLLKAYDKDKAKVQKSEIGISQQGLDEYLLMLQWLEGQRLAAVDNSGAKIDQ